MKPIEDIIAGMSNDEKVALLTGSGLWRTASLPQHDIPSVLMTDGTYGVRYSTSQIDGDEGWSLADFAAVVNQRPSEHTESGDGPGIEEMFGASRPATCFPNGSSVACSWDVELAHTMGQALGRECQHFGVGVLLGPGINLRRTPLGGRGYEYFSEDPVVSGDLAAALINGLQGEGVGASLKHFACNNSEYRRTQTDSLVEDRALHEIYLEGFRRAIEKSKPWTVMSSYNLLNGTQTAHHHELLTQILRDQWGFDGLVMSDWYGIKDRPESLRAGNDLAMPETRVDKETLLRAIEEGEVSTSIVNRACARVVTLAKKAAEHRKPEFQADFVAHHGLAQKIAEESAVLLRNVDNILPLEADRFTRIAIIGKPAHEPVIQGSGCATTTPYLLDRPLDEIIDIASENFEIKFAVGASNDDELKEGELAAAVDLAKWSDVAVVFVSTVVGKDGENGDRENLDIIRSHEALIHAIADVQQNVVVVLANSDAVVMPWLDRCKGLLEMFFAGQGMGRAVANILFGHVNPSGKLTVTIPNKVEETPGWLHYPGECFKHRYDEGIYVGYRYYDKRKIEPRFPFGFGLSYTNFSYSELRVSGNKISHDTSLEISFDLKNCGNRWGKEIAQLYVSVPSVTLHREAMALKSFVKVALKPGESRRVSMTIEAKDVAAYHPVLKRWVLEPGELGVHVCRSSRDVALSAHVSIDAERTRLPLRIDSSLEQLVDQPDAMERIVSLIASKTNEEKDSIAQRLVAAAPTIINGLYTALTEFFGVNISRAELQRSLTGEGV
jgi:beta-glucosidase